MKTTNLEISKKLREIGFKERSHLCHRSDRKSVYLTDGSKENFICYSYDLETIIDALPWCVKVNDELYDLCVHETGMWYESQTNKHECLLLVNRDVFVDPKEYSQSLADTAARLLIELVEADIINFKGE